MSQINMVDGAWHLDKRVNLATIIAFATAVLGVVAWLNATRTDVATNARSIQDLGRIIEVNHNAIEGLRAKDGASRERLARVEKSIESTNELLQRILVSIDRLNDRMNRSNQAHGLQGGSK